MTYRDIDPKLAGIYLFKNNINGKCYIGQGVSIRKRLKHHLSNIRNKRYDLPLYRAIEKYGLHNFTIDIVESFIPDESITTEQLINKLDDLEIKYIEQYEGYTKGYNCTKGGDCGVLGLKMTDEQRKKVSENTKKLIRDGIIGKRVYMYNFIDKYYIYAHTIKAASTITGLSGSNISKLCNNKYIHPFCNNFIADFSKEELEKKKDKIYSLWKEYETNRHCNSDWYKGMPGLNKGKKMSEIQKEKLRNSSTKYFVYQYSKNGELLNTFKGMHNAAKAVNTDYNSIKRACNGKAKTCKGFTWKKELIQSTC